MSDADFKAILLWWAICIALGAFGGCVANFLPLP